MNEAINLKQDGMLRWVPAEALTPLTDVERRCDVEAIQRAVAHLGEVRVVSAELNTSGRFEAPAAVKEQIAVAPFVENLPDFIDVRVEQTTPGGHVAQIIVWVPLEWNGRFFGVAGGGMRTLSDWFDLVPSRAATHASVLRNGFAVAGTDGGIRDLRPDAYAFDEQTREIDWELLRNWSHRATHDMTLVGKAVTEAVTGSAPRFSYFSGGSGGGRQSMAQAQRYPEDYDGIWATDPAINWSHFVPATIWPALVMNQLGNVLPPEKFEAFRQAAIAVTDGADGLTDGLPKTLGEVDIDPFTVVGTPTSAGEITVADAEVVQKIWQGPRTMDGEFLWHGLHPHAESWGTNFVRIGIAGTQEVDGQLEPVPFFHPLDWLGIYLLRDPAWDWKTLTFEQFEELFARSVTEFAEFDTADPDLTGLRDAGAKLLITHATGDEVIFYQGTVDYYRRVQEAMGGPEETSKFARLFITPGAGHVHMAGQNAAATLAGSMIALMRWVEEGVAPESLRADRYDVATGEVTMSRPVYPWPTETVYRGQGDPTELASFGPAGE